jgi:ABC-2 type transport system ATP-binding protein
MSAVVGEAVAGGNEDAIVIESVAKTFTAGRQRIRALDGVSAAVGHGRVTGLIGPDGAGKTTLMRLIAGLLRPDAGQLQVLGMDVSEQPLEVQGVLRYMPQRFGLYEDLTVQENLDLYADLQHVEPAARPPRYEELMHMTGLAPFTDRLAGHLSGGMKQKLGLACTLVRSPRLLLLDEPTAGVDPVSRRELWEIVYRQVNDAGMSVLFSTAYLDEAERCDEVLLLHQGQLIGQGRPDDFSQRLAGRTWQVPAAGTSRRSLQQRLARRPDVLDATVQGDHVRLVMQEGAEFGDGDDAGLKAEPVPPRFEDAFVAMLGTAGNMHGSDQDALPVDSSLPHADEAVIQVRGLSRNFGDFQAVKAIDFHVERGEVFGLLGANGAGKSTTFRMLCGLLPASAGELTVAGVNLRQAPASARSRIGYMSQRFSLYGTLSVMDNLRFFSSAYGLSGPRRSERIEWACTHFDLQHVAAMSADALPLGFKQRLAMACALLHEPNILFLDEPTSGVDPLARREFWQRINSLADQGVTVLVTTHFMEEAEYCDRLVIMAEGEILAEGEPAEIKREAAATGQPAATMEDAFIALIQRQPETAST